MLVFSRVEITGRGCPRILMVNQSTEGSHKKILFIKEKEDFCGYMDVHFNVLVFSDCH